MAHGLKASSCHPLSMLKLIKVWRERKMFFFFRTLNEIQEKTNELDNKIIHDTNEGDDLKTFIYI